MRSVKVYIEPADWWVGYYRGPNHHYVCPLPLVVIRWPRHHPEPPVTADHTPERLSAEDALQAVIDNEVYGTIVIRPEHAQGCSGDCPNHGCPVPVQDYGDTRDLAVAILASDWLREHVAAHLADPSEPTTERTVTT